jgi:squalene-hopene/tetraprenyl-beta-curcumene cyclase
MEDRNCASCHHLPMMIWSLREAKTNGISIDDEVLAKAIEWTLSSKVEATTFPKAEKPEQDRVSMAAAYIALALAGSDSGPPEWWTAMLGNATHYQQADGSWPTQTGGRPPILSPATTHLTLLMTNALATQTGKQSDPVTSAAQEKALAWLASQPAEETTQYHAFRLLLDVRLSRALEKAKQSIEWLRAQQKNDGGWGPSPAEASDAYATGQAVYALIASGVAPDDAAIQRAREFLTKTQTADGSWPMISRPTATSTKGAGNLEPITYAATAWATMALSRSQPRK